MGKLKHPHEGDRGDNREERGRVFERAGKGREACVIAPEAAGGTGRQRVHHRVEAAHPQRGIGQRAGGGDAQVKLGHLGRDLARPRHDLAHGVEAFRPEELHPPHPHDRQEGHRHDDDPQAPRPLQDPAPQMRAQRQAVELLEGRRPGRGHARHRFEHRVGPACPRRPQHEGQGAKHRQGRPEARGQKKGLLDLQPPAFATGRQHGHQAQNDRPGSGRREGAPVRVAHAPVHGGRQQHQPAHGDRKLGDRLDDGADVDHPP